MSESIGLAEFIAQVKRELLATSDGKDAANPPLLVLDSVELEVQVTASKEGKAGVNIQVVELGGAGKHQDAHTVKLTMSPILTHQELVAALRGSGRWDTDAVIQGQLTGAMKALGPTSQRKD